MLARAAALLILLHTVSGCDRLNPDWCEDKASCAADDYCDPGTNTCRPREAGVTHDTTPRTDAVREVGADLPPSDSGVDGPVKPDSAPDLVPAPDQRPPDLPPVKDLPAG